MEPLELGATGGMVALAMAAVRLAEKAISKRNGNGNDLNTRLLLLEQRCVALGEDLIEVRDKVRESLSVIYQLREELRIQQARDQAVKEVTKERA